uniref:Uncharacterized protein n=1 Tax=Globisporangium ultimum (strain ATCC 200006 / CBS 805.95 / DAOM BR144) TaxID=431595 RepID=K3WA33_GLOUD
RLFLIIIGIVTTIVDVEVTKFVGVLVRSNDVKVVTQLLLLQVLLGQVLKVTLREWSNGRNVQFVLFARDLDGVTEHTDLATDLDAVVQELLERGRVKHTVIDWDGAVNGELEHLLLPDLLSLVLLSRKIAPRD